MLDVVHVHQVHVFYLAALVDIDFLAGIESLEVRLFEEREVPWDELAFRTVSTTLRHYFDDRRRGRFELHTGTIEWSSRAAVGPAPAPAAVASTSPGR